MTRPSRQPNLVIVAVVPALCGLVISYGAWADKSPDVDRMFQMMDTNGDHKISADEHTAGARKMFETMDANKDGQVTATEMDAAHEKITGRSKKPQMSAAEKIKVIDTNNDGVLSADEHIAGAKMAFEKMDVDGNGFLTKAELEAGHAKMLSSKPSKK